MKNKVNAPTPPVKRSKKWAPLELGLCLLVAGGWSVGGGRGTKHGGASRSSSSTAAAVWGASHFLASSPFDDNRAINRRSSAVGVNNDGNNATTTASAADVGALLRSLASKQGRKYSLDSVRLSLEAILQQGVSTTHASEMYGINRSTLQFYLKKLNVVRRRRMVYRPSEAGGRSAQ